MQDANGPVRCGAQVVINEFVVKELFLERAGCHVPLNVKERLMKLGCFILMITPFLLFSNPVSADDLIGLYFDSSATDVCRQDIQVYPYVENVYIIAQDLSCTGGLSGWEAMIDSDIGIYVSLISISGDAINILSFPRFQVGLGTTIPRAELIILATLEVVAVQSGGIYIKGLETGSLYSGTPNYADGHDPSNLCVFNHRFGSNEEPALVIGMIDCPRENDTFSVSPENNTSWGSIKALYR